MLDQEPQSGRSQNDAQVDRLTSGQRGILKQPSDFKMKMKNRKKAQIKEENEVEKKSVSFDKSVVFDESSK